MFSGFQLPKIITARAKKPKPSHVPVGGAVGRGQGIDKAPIPARAPEMVVPAYRILYTLMPKESAAWGFSPQARSRRPNRVLYSRTAKNKEKKDAQVSGQIGSVDEGLPQGAHVLHPSISKHGLFDHEPAGSISVRHLQGILVGDNTDEEEHQGGRIRFSAVPPMVWSARRLMEANDRSREKNRPQKRRQPPCP